MIYPEDGGKGGRGKKDSAKETAKKVGGFSDERLRQARTVLRLAKQYDSMKIVTAVLAGELGLDDAMSSMKEIDDKATSEKDKADASSKELANLRKAAPVTQKVGERKKHEGAGHDLPGAGEGSSRQEQRTGKAFRN